MKKLMGIYQITINKEADTIAFEKYMKSRVFTEIGVGRQTRGGIITEQYLVKEDSSVILHDYSWVIHWTNQGGSPFGSKNAPNDPANLLTEFGAKTSFSRYVVI